MFNEEFVKELPHDILKAQLKICERFFECCETDAADNTDICLQAMAFAQIFEAVHSLNLEVPDLDHRYNDRTKVQLVVNFFNKWSGEINKQLKNLQQTDTFETAKDTYASMFGKGVFYEFSDDDYTRVQELLNKLRDLLANSEDFEEDHRRRLFKKLEALQLEFHKRMSDFDKFWGFFIDSSIAFRKSWENAKPFIDDVKEILQIVSRTQAKAENIQKLLPLNLLKSGDSDPGDDEE